MSAQLPAVLAIDGGNSKTDVALVAADGTLLASVRGPGASHQGVGMELAMRALDAMVRETARQAGLPGDHARDSGQAARDSGPAGGHLASHTSACLAGADLPEEEQQLAEEIGRRGWSATTTVANDTFAVLRAGLDDAGGPAALGAPAALGGPAAGAPAALGGRPCLPWGVGVTCGAGINCVGVAPDGRTTRFLAFGPLTGDRGGGGWIGQEVMWWAYRAEDGRGPDTGLREAVAAHFGLPTVRDVAVACYRRTIAEDRLRELAAVLFDVAGCGDKVALDLVDVLADEVCTMALVAMRRLGLTGLATPVVLGGGILAARDPHLIAGVTGRLSDAAPLARVRVVDVPPVVGAALLGLDRVGAEPGAGKRLRASFPGSPAQAPPAQAPPAPAPPAPAAKILDDF